ncbi:cytochrome-c peroxidase [Geomonas sp. Red32]|uniref:cytochrome-c peroxidase n=1 Tax=Geomonas sp. Red32 TaxID=2912856 RepID=UPI00202CAD0E|nr:cytochrome-c peroxidase [Geomonas sp. Red32]MCM0080331.1 cytochrome-c peroxidase [Geomonas sp. Red32]
MRRLLPGCFLVLMLTALAWGDDGTLKKARGYFSPLPASPPKIAKIQTSPVKVELGKMLYFDPRLSASNLISCASCHNLGLGGVDLQETSVGHGWQKGPRNAPTVLNAVFNAAQFWDGRAKDLEAQAKGPVQAGVEMNNKPERVVATLKSIPGYAPLFKKAFPADSDPVTFDNVARAIEAFEATLITPGAPFDRYLKGDQKALTASEKSGLKLFMDKGCAACHGGVNLGGAGYFPFGVKETPASEVRPASDVGRYAVTKTESDRYVYKAPSLRNIALTAPYFHSGKVWGLEQAVTIMGSSQLGISLKPGEEKEIVAFLRTLTGKQPRVMFPILPPSSDSTPKPLLM